MRPNWLGLCPNSNRAQWTRRQHDSHGRGLLGTDGSLGVEAPAVGNGGDEAERGSPGKTLQAPQNLGP